MVPSTKLVLLFLWACAAILVIFTVVLISQSAHGQEVIMNQPSADIVDKGHTFVRFDEFYTQKPAFYMENLNLAYGLGHNLEVSLNNTNAFNRAPMSDALVLGFKYAPFKKEWLKCGKPHAQPTFKDPVTNCVVERVTFYMGDQFVQPLTNKMPGFSQGNITYEAAALSLGAWRFTAGAFQSHNGVQIGNRAGALGGIEYTRMFNHGKWGLAPGIDYASGAGTNGYVSPGLNIMKGNFFLCPGYMIANPRNPNGAHQSFIMAGYTF